MARKCNEHNERVKRRYLTYLREAKRKSQLSVDKAAAAIVRFESSTGFRNFKDFHIDQAVGFKRALEREVHSGSGKPLSKATMSATLRDVKAFFVWLADQPGFRSRIGYSDCDYFNLSAADERVAHAHIEKPAPTMEQITHALAEMPFASDVEKRDRAVFALIALTGGRDGAVASLKLKHVDLVERMVHFDAREVRTKSAKTFRTWFFPVPEEFESCVVDYIRFLREGLLFGANDPLFPKTRIAVGPCGGFAPVGLAREHWSSAAPIRKTFKAAFERVGIEPFGPHSFRRTLALLGEPLCTTPETFKAWSQNLGHEQVLTTFNSYGNVAPRRQAELIRTLREKVSFETRAEPSAPAAGYRSRLADVP